MIQKTLHRKLRWSNTNTKQIPKNRRKQHEHKTNTKKQKKTTRTQNKYQKIEENNTNTKQIAKNRCSRRISSSCFLSNNCRCYSMFGQSLSLVVCRRAHVLFTLFTCLFTQSGVQHICCVFVLFSLVLCILCCQFLWNVLF